MYFRFFFLARGGCRGWCFLPSASTAEATQPVGWHDAGCTVPKVGPKRRLKRFSSRLELFPGSGRCFGFLFFRFWERLPQLTNIFGKALNHQLVVLLKVIFDFGPYLRAFCFFWGGAVAFPG